MWIVFCVDINSFLPLHLAHGRPRTSQEDLIPDSSGWWCQDCQDLWAECALQPLPAQIQFIPQRWLFVNSYVNLFTLHSQLTLDNVHDEFMTMQTVHIFIVSYRKLFSSAVLHKTMLSAWFSALFIARPCVTCHTGCPVSGHCEARAPQTQWHWALVTRQTEWGSDRQRQWEGTLHHFPDCLALWGQTQLDDSHSSTTWMFYSVIERR